MQIKKTPYISWKIISSPDAKDFFKNFILSMTFENVIETFHSELFRAWGAIIW